MPVCLIKPCILLVRIKTSWKSIWRFLSKTPIKKPLLYISPKDSKPVCQRNACKSVVTAALFMLPTLQNHPRCSAIEEWVKKWSKYTLWFCHHEEEWHCSFQENVMENNYIKWSQPDSDKYHVFCHLWFLDLLEICKIIYIYIIMNYIYVCIYTYIYIWH